MLLDTGHRAVLDRRLDAASSAPLAVGFSGGGDSLFLLKAALDWARPSGRPVLALVVDHRLQADSARWTAQAVEKARALGAEARALAWTGPKPAAGLPAAARRARHALLAEAAREAGAKVLLLGHTASDLAESAAMRAEGSTVPDPRAWSPSPVWPEGRDVFLLRPLLFLTRGEIRAALAAEGQTWLEDPANVDLRYARARARASGAEIVAPEPDVERRPPLFSIDEAGAVRLPRDIAAAHLAAALLCAAGTERPPRGERLERLLQRLRSGEGFTATLSGARIEAGEMALICRDAGETARGGLAPLSLAPGETGVWDGRWEITAGVEPLTVVALKGRASSLSPDQRARLVTLPAAVRPSSPLILRQGAAPCSPVLDGRDFAAEGGGRARLLVLDRLKAAVGLYDQECVT
ncbi:tRNA lysidine(34) synthetase TilS [Caulobacter segnis]|uniref:tRNA(Ile)-lysidine synthase n=2 Tax=Caulobacter segnis TaxID=88688 RepID=D5VEQ8_CAUST|nr:tRNA lysidine(34) synthetase TilS [Caulobacter segnis]ADG09201.1 tRNA(Ile)-lysidine synthetase [Caulobacter segnis ATCC 21756]AVQ01016.1 tRNA lysidine(34) synthetase TilS [Caulobacter segnis]